MTGAFPYRGKKWVFFRVHPHDDERLVPNYLEIDNLINNMLSRSQHWNCSHTSQRYMWSTQQAMNFRQVYKLLELVENIGEEGAFDFLMALKLRIEYPIHKQFSMRQMDVVVNGLEADQVQMCHDCDGTGYAQTERAPCPSCGGSGENTPTGTPTGEVVQE
mgnify:CR=1 FL=1